MKLLKNRRFTSIIVTAILAVIFAIPALTIYKDIRELIFNVLDKNVADTSITTTVLQELVDKIGKIIFMSFLGIVLFVSLVVNKLLDMRSKALETDYLTGLFSKRYHEHQLHNIIKDTKKTDKPLSLIMIDVDNFKEINDQFGHQVGDRVLRAVAQITQMNLRSADICSRYGGDEFIIILPDTKQENAALIGERIRDKIFGQDLNIDGADSIRASLSMGIVEWNHMVNADKLTECADQAMYCSKNSGKNAITIYKESKLAIC